jgi:SAM-dependent methyltransferase
VADAARLPIATEFADVALAMHMLYHVPEPAEAVRELRRVLRPGGCALVLLNSTDHLAELRAQVREVSEALGVPMAGTRPETVRVEDASPMLEAAFNDVELHMAIGELVVSEPAPVVAYVASMSPILAAGPDGSSVLAELNRAVADTIRRQGAFRTRISAGCFVCR